MLEAIRHISGRILVNFHLIVLMALPASAPWIVRQTGFSNWQVGLAALGIFLFLFLLRCLILARYVTGRWGFRSLNDFYSKDGANRFYDPWEQKRLYIEE